MAEAEYWRFTVARDCQKKNTSETHSGYSLAGDDRALAVVLKQVEMVAVWFGALLTFAACPLTPCVTALEVYVDPLGGDDLSLSASSVQPLRTVHAAAAHVRQLLDLSPGVDIDVQLLPGLHHVGDGPLSLGPADGGRGNATVTWRSFGGPAAPATIGAPVRVTGWKAHPKVKGAFSAPLPSNITKGSSLRQFWVNGLRAERPKIYGHGRQPGDNRNGHCLNLTNITRTPMYPEGSQFDFNGENATDPSTWENPGDVEFVYTSCDAINCWIEPRCTVESVEGSKVSLKQSSGNSSCFHRLYYYSQCFNNGKGPGRTGKRGKKEHTMIKTCSTSLCVL